MTSAASMAGLIYAKVLKIMFLQGMSLKYSAAWNVYVKIDLIIYIFVKSSRCNWRLGLRMTQTLRTI